VVGVNGERGDHGFVFVCGGAKKLRYLSEFFFLKIKKK
jgi:hypothetical protein